MSEQQVLPPRPKIRSDEHYNLVFDAEPADTYMDALEAESATLRASLAQSEAERERLQEKYDDAMFEWIADQKQLRAELARERELLRRAYPAVVTCTDKEVSGCQFYKHYEALREELRAVLGESNAKG